MKKNMKKAVIKTVGAVSFVGCAVMNSQFAMAAPSDWYGGFGVGQSRAEVDDGRIRSELLGSGLTVTSIGDNERDLAYKLFGGYKINRNFALEAGFFHLGEFGFEATTSPAGTLSGKTKLRGLNFDAVGLLPLGEKLSAFGRLGMQYGYAKDSFTGSGAVVVAEPRHSTRAGNYKAGLGVQYDFTDALGLRGEWERYRLNDGVRNRGDIDMVSVGLVFMFGADKPAPAPAPLARVETPPPPAPAPVVAAAVEPVRVIVPVKEQTAQYCSILDIQFEINQEEIQREEKEKFAVLATFLKKYPDTTAVIEGHSDNVGKSEDNIKLSQHRAESVVNYLVAEHQIPASRLTAVGYGETRPLADNSTEEGKRMNRRIDAVIACATDIEGLTVVPARTTMAMEMEFDPYKHDIKPQYRDDLRKVANFLNANPTVTATVEGHADKVAGIGAQQTHPTPEVSMKVSQERAQAVVDYLANDLGVSRSRLTAAGFGQTRRVDYGTTLEGQQENRRVNIVVNYPK